MRMSRRALLCGIFAAGLPHKGAGAPASGFIELRALRNAFDGTVPGPLLQAAQGREIAIRVYNEMAAPIAVHWQGVRVPNAMDGTALTQSPIRPGASFDYGFAPPDAGTFAYRATVARSLSQAHGLHGMLIVHGEREKELFDLPLILDEDEDGLLVNGVSRPMLQAPAAKTLRLRILHAGSGKALRLVLDAEEARIIAHDGHPAGPSPITEASVEIWPWQRMDIAVPPSAEPLELSVLTEAGRVSLAAILRQGSPPEVAPPQIALKPNPLPDYFNYAASHQATLTIERPSPDGSGWTVNGERGLGAKPLFSVPRGTTVTLTVDNISRMGHVLHIHGHAAKLIELAGRPIAAPVWRDSFAVRPLEPAKLLFIADNPGKWLIASTRAEAFDRGLQAWFEVS
jgi:FtsP/CotA-like multicopper oxidase with cupredoxin domain